MTEGVTDPVEEQLAAYNVRDLERFLVCFAPDVRVEDGRGKLLLKGHRQLRGHYGAAFAKYPHAHCTILHRIRIAQYVVDEEQLTGMGVPVTQAVAIYRVAGAQISHVRFLGEEADRWTSARRRAGRILHPLWRRVLAKVGRQKGMLELRGVGMFQRQRT